MALSIITTFVQLARDEKKVFKTGYWVFSNCCSSSGFSLCVCCDMQEGLILAGFPQGMPQQGASRNTNVQAGAAARDGESNASADVLPLDDQAAEGQSRAASEEQSEQASEGGPMLSATHQLALRFRTQKKMMLWDVLIAHGKTMAEKQAAINSAK